MRQKSCRKYNSNGFKLLKSNVDIRGLVALGRISGGYFITTFLNNVLPFLFLPILTRYLNPSAYANIALFGFYLAISNAITGVSVPIVISKHFFDRPKDYIAKIIGNSIIIVFCFSLITMLIILIVYPFFKNVLDLPLFWLLIIPLVSFSFIIFSINLNVLRNNKKILLFSYYQIGNTVTNILISLLLVVILLWGWQGRVWGIMLGFFISAIWSFIYLKKNNYISFSVSGEIIKSILNIVLPLIPNSFQSVIISQVGIFFIQYYFTKELLGIYSVGLQIAMVIKMLIDTLGLSWSPFLYEQLSKPEKFKRLYITRLFYSLFGIVFLGVIIINVFSGLILRIMTTHLFFGANEFILWLTLGLLFHGMYVFLMPILIKYNRQKYISIISLTNMFIMLVLNYVFIKLFGHIGVAYAFFVTYLLMFVAFFWQSQKIMHLPWLKALKVWKL
jgi:O-antigen/teichoic acid export membrane protein